MLLAGHRVLQCPSVARRRDRSRIRGRGRRRANLLCSPHFEHRHLPMRLIAGKLDLITLIHGIWDLLKGMVEYLIFINNPALIFRNPAVMTGTIFHDLVDRKVLEAGVGG